MKTSLSLLMKTMSALLRAAPLIAMQVVLAGCTGETPAATDPPPAVFDSTVLHQIDIKVDAAYLPGLASDLDNRFPSTIVYDGEVVEQAGIRQKGNTAIPLESKPSFSVRFDEFDDKADLHGLHKILLNNSLQDPSFLREKLGAEAHARIGLPAARIAHAKVTLNGADKGIYVVAEAIDKDFLQLHYGKDFDEGNLYEGPCCGDFAVDATYREVDMGLDDEKKDNRTRDDIRALAEVIVTAPDATFAVEVEKKLDLDQFIKMYALEVLLLHWDGFAFRRNNYYMYDHPADARFVFFPHGMDRILDDLGFDFSPLALEAKLPQRIHAIPALEARYQMHLAQLETSAWNASAMQASIDQTFGMLQKAGSGTQTSADLAQLEAKIIELRNVVTIVDTKIKQ